MVILFSCVNWQANSEKIINFDATFHRKCQLIYQQWKEKNNEDETIFKNRSTEANVNGVHRQVERKTSMPASITNR